MERVRAILSQRELNKTDTLRLINPETILRAHGAIEPADEIVREIENRLAALERGDKPAD